MAEYETIKIPELSPTNTANAEDQLIIRQGLTDKRIAVSALQSGIVGQATLSTPGVVRLNNTVVSTSISEAATANAVRLAYERGTQAINSVSGFQAQINGKANINHTHSASQITSGVMDWQRLPLGNASNHGVVRIDPSLGNSGQSSSGGYVPSIERINSLQTTINQLQQTINQLELGSAFMPLPINNAGDLYTSDFPIGSYVLASAGNNVGQRNSRIYVSPVRAGAPSFTDAWAGQFSIGGFPESNNLQGVWLHRGAVGPYHNPSSKGLKGFFTNPQNDIGADYNVPLNVAILCQRVA